MIKLLLLAAAVAFSFPLQDNDTRPPISPTLERSFLQHLRFSSAAACDQSLLQSWSCKWCSYPLVATTKVSTTFFNSKTATKGYTAVHHESRSIIVAFRGTVDLAGVFQDMQFILKKAKTLFGDVLLHTGFLDAYISVRDNLLVDVDKLVQQYPDHTVTFTGHSLGGALAIIAGLDYARQHPEHSVDVFAITPPRVGNADFVHAVSHQGNLKTHRLMNSRDGISQMPPTWFGYRHVDDEYWIPQLGGKAVVCQPGEDPKCSAGAGLYALTYDLHNSMYGFKYEACSA
jgi:hypothetical protein